MRQIHRFIYRYIHTYRYRCIVCMLSHFTRVQLFAVLWTVACQGPWSIGFSRQEHWSRLPCPPQFIVHTHTHTHTHILECKSQCESRRSSMSQFKWSEKEPEFSFSSPFCSIQATNKLDDVFPLWGSYLLYLVQAYKHQPLSHGHLFTTIACSLPGSSAHGILQARTLGSHSLLQGIFLTQIWHLVSCITGRFFTI